VPPPSPRSAASSRTGLARCDRRPVDERPRRDGRILGCLLGGAVGDALGAPVEFRSLAEIHNRFGPEGVSTFASAYGREGAITDDTQMTLFTAEGLMRAHNRATSKGICSVPDVVWYAYLRWLHTQGFDVMASRLTKRSPARRLADHSSRAARATSAR
jgi:hypothetical protein